MTNEDLFRQQKELLDTFLNTGAITKAQYDFSLNGLIEKMHLNKDWSSEKSDQKVSEENFKILSQNKDNRN